MVDRAIGFVGRRGFATCFSYSCAIIAFLRADEGPGDDAVDGFGTGELDQGPRDLAHYTARAPAVDEVDVGLVHGFGEVAGGLEVGGVDSRRGGTAGAGVNTCLDKRD